MKFSLIIYVFLTAFPNESALIIEDLNPGLEAHEEGVYIDAENKICFVDLMAFDETILSISLQDENGVELESVNCLNLDVREIVEFDLQAYSQDEFLLSFDSPARKICSTISL